MSAEVKANAYSTDDDRELWIAVRRATLQLVRVLERVERRHGQPIAKMEHIAN